MTLPTSFTSGVQRVQSKSEYMEDARRRTKSHKTKLQSIFFISKVERTQSTKQRSTSVPLRSQKGVLVYLAITCVSWSPSNTPMTLLATDVNIISKRYANDQIILYNTIVQKMRDLAILYLLP